MDIKLIWIIVKDNKDFIIFELVSIKLYIGGILAYI